MQTVQAMKRIADIKLRREDRFWENRMKLAKVQKQVDIERELLKNDSLLKDGEKKEEMRERIKLREVDREEEKQEKRAKSKGRMMVVEEEEL